MITISRLDRYHVNHLLMELHFFRSGRIFFFPEEALNINETEGVKIKEVNRKNSFAKI